MFNNKFNNNYSIVKYTKLHFLIRNINVDLSLLIFYFLYIFVYCKQQIALICKILKICFFILKIIRVNSNK